MDDCRMTCTEVLFELAGAIAINITRHSSSFLHEVMSPATLDL